MNPLYTIPNVTCKSGVLPETKFTSQGVFSVCPDNSEISCGCSSGYGKNYKIEKKDKGILIVGNCYRQDFVLYLLAGFGALGAASLLSTILTEED